MATAQELRDQLAACATWWDVMCVLADAWRDRPAGTEHPENLVGDDFERWARLIDVTQEGLGSADEIEPHAQIADLIARLGDCEPWQVHAVAHAVDSRRWQLFTEGWLAGRDGPFILEAGDPYPVCDWVGPPGWKYTMRPGNVREGDDEFWHLRRYREPDLEGKPVQVVFDPTHRRLFDAALEELKVTASIHPNADWGDLDVPEGLTPFPIKPDKAEAQLGLIQAGLTAATAAAATVVVVGELSTTPEIVASLRADVAELDVTALVVPGSCHVVVGEEPANVATILIGDAQGATLEHRKIVPYVIYPKAGPPTKEGIVPGPRSITVHVGRTTRFASVICKDLIDSTVRYALARAGVNVLAVPAMSEDMAVYLTIADDFVLASQGAVVVANNPSADHLGGAVDPVAVFGQPLVGASRAVPPVAAERTPTGVAVFAFGGGAAAWIKL